MLSPCLLRAKGTCASCSHVRKIPTDVRYTKPPHIINPQLLEFRILVGIGRGPSCM